MTARCTDAETEPEARLFLLGLEAGPQTLLVEGWVLIGCSKVLSAAPVLAGQAQDRMGGIPSWLSLTQASLRCLLGMSVRFQEPLTKSTDPGVCGEQMWQRVVPLACQAGAPTFCRGSWVSEWQTHHVPDAKHSFWKFGAHRHCVCHSQRAGEADGGPSALTPVPPASRPCRRGSSRPDARGTR